ncbi:MAG: DUF5698 domain-containing protein [Actinomycetota bacterium]
MSTDTILSTLQMVGMAVMSVSLWTLRVALTARGRKLAGSMTACVEAVVFLLAFSSVLGDLDAVEKVVGYALGVGAGTLLGVLADERLSTGQSEVRIVTEGSDATLVRELRRLGWPVTLMYGNGPSGDVTVAFVAVDDTRLPHVLRDLEKYAPQAFWTVERLQSARSVQLPEGCIGIRGGATVGLRGRLPRRAAVSATQAEAQDLISYEEASRPQFVNEAVKCAEV